MARRPLVPKPVNPTLYSSIEECEQAEETGGLHLAEVRTWPPPRSRAGEANPQLSVRCVRCGGHLLVYGDNDPVESGIEVRVLEVAAGKPEEPTKKK